MESIREHVGIYCVRTGSSKKQLADSLDMPYSTFLSKLNGPSEFSFSEGLALSRLIGISPDTLATPTGSVEISRSEYSDLNSSSSQDEEEEPSDSSL